MHKKRREFSLMTNIHRITSQPVGTSKICTAYCIRQANAMTRLTVTACYSKHLTNTTYSHASTRIMNFAPPARRVSRLIVQ